MPQMTTPLLFLAFMATFVGIRNLLCYRFAGWSRLERHFPRGKPQYIGLVSKGSYLGVSGSVSFLPVNFNVEVCREFLWIRPAALGMTGVSIPWEAIRQIDLQRGFMRRVGTITLKDVDVRLRMSGCAAELASALWEESRCTKTAMPA